MALKDGTTSKNMLSRGLTSLLDSGKNKVLLLLLLLLVVLLELLPSTQNSSTAKS